MFLLTYVRTTYICDSLIGKIQLCVILLSKKLLHRLPSTQIEVIVQIKAWIFASQYVSKTQHLKKTLLSKTMCLFQRSSWPWHLSELVHMLMGKVIVFYVIENV